jgi:hypothetical protein
VAISKSPRVHKEWHRTSGAFGLRTRWRALRYSTQKEPLLTKPSHGSTPTKPDDDRAGSDEPR